MNKVTRFFDKLEDHVRGRLSRVPILYALIGGAGVVIYWRGVWHLIDYLMRIFFSNGLVNTTIDSVGLPWWDGLLSIVAGGSILLLTGVFVPSFIGNEIIISGLRGEKKLTEKTVAEVKEESEVVQRISRDMQIMNSQLEQINKKIQTYHGK